MGEALPDVALEAKTYWYYTIYEMIAAGELDFGIVSRELHAENVSVHPMVSEAMLFACRSDSTRFADVRHCRDIDPEYLIRVDWCSSYNTWFEQWFGMRAAPLVELDKVSLIERYIVRDDFSCFVPVSVADEFAKNPAIAISGVEAHPPDRILYVLTPAPASRMAPLASEAFEVLAAELKADSAGKRGRKVLY